MPFISCIINDMNSSAMYIINKETEGLVGRNAFSMAIDATKLVDVVRLYQQYNAIVGVVNTQVFLCLWNGQG